MSEPSPGVPRAQLAGSLGAVIRVRRQALEMTLQQLSERAGVSSGLLSQLERGNGNPSLLTLVQIAQALDVPVGSFFTDLENASPVVRNDARETGTGHPHGAAEFRFELLTPPHVRELEAMLITTEPGHDTSDTPFRHSGFEFGYVIEGVKDVYLDGVLHQLHPGDTITYPSNIPHWYGNSGDSPSIAVWVMG